jgi:uncharacterized protein YacL
VEDVRFINIHALSSSIQPSVFTGEQIDIHIRRPGKDLTQGIGFLDDGSMVVVNGAGSYVGQTVTCFILSVKKSMTGRLVFANLVENRVSQAFKATISNLDTANETDESKAKELQ